MDVYHNIGAQKRAPLFYERMSILDMTDKADIPEFIQKHEATLRFPEKVSIL